MNQSINALETYIDGSAPNPRLFPQTEYLPHRHAWKKKSNKKKSCKDAEKNLLLILKEL